MNVKGNDSELLKFEENAVANIPWEMQRDY